MASGPEPRHMRRYPPRHDLHSMKANMERASHASVCDVGYFPPCALAATCGTGVRLTAPPVASRCSARVPPHRRSKPSKGVAAKAVGEGKAASPRNTLARVSSNPAAFPCTNAEKPTESESTRREPPTVPDRSKSCQDVSTHADVAASGLVKHPLPTFVGDPDKGVGRETESR